jgi:hypothetical protein
MSFTTSVTSTTPSPFRAAVAGRGSNTPIYSGYPRRIRARSCSSRISPSVVRQQPEPLRPGCGPPSQIQPGGSQHRFIQRGRNDLRSRREIRPGVSHTIQMTTGRSSSKLWATSLRRSKSSSAERGKYPPAEPTRARFFYPVLTPSQWPKSHRSGLFSIDTRSELSTDDIICIEAPSRPRGVCVATTKIGVVGGDP